MRIKDIYSGLFLGFALNEFIDQADTSTLNYLKYYETAKGQLSNPFEGLPDDDFPNSFLYNCDKLLYVHFLSIGTGTEFSVNKQNHWGDWSPANCKDRHVYSLNGFWNDILYTIQQEIILRFNGGNNGFDTVVANRAIELLRKIKFTDFETIGNPNGTDYRRLLYKYPLFTYNGSTYFYTTTQSLCAQNIEKNVTGNNVKPRPEGKETKEQRSCIAGLNAILNGEGATPEQRAHFFMLLKYIGDTSHLVLHDIFTKFINYDGIDKSNLGIYLSERPLLVRAFAQDMNIYCKYLSKFSERNIVKRPGEVIKISSDPPKVINAKRAKSYITDLDAVMKLATNADLTFYSLSTPLEGWIEYYLSPTNERVVLDNAAIQQMNQNMAQDMSKVNIYHPIIKQINSCIDLFVRTKTFIEDMIFVNKTIVPSNFFVRRRSMVLSKISSFVSSFIDKVIQKKNRERFNRALEYLSTYNSIIKTYTDIGNGNRDELSRLLEFALFNVLNGEISSQGRNKFQKVSSIYIPDTGTQNVRNLRDTPHIFQKWIEDNYLVMKKLSPSSSQGIQNITDYLIMYDYLMNNVQGVAVPQRGAASAETQ